MNRPGRVLLAAVACGLSIAAPAGAAPVEGSGFELSVGFAGAYRSGSWTPLVVASAADADHPITAGDVLHVWVEDPDGQFVRSPPVTVTTTPAGRSAARFCIRFGRPSGRVRIEHGPRISECRVGEPIPAGDRVLLVCGDLPAAGRALRLLDGEDGPRQRLATLTADDATAADDGVAEARDLDGVDAIVLCGSGLDTVTTAMLHRIDAWVQRGGRLVLLAGASAAGLAERPPAAAWLPGRIDRFVSLRRFGPLEAYARSGRLQPPAAGVQVPMFADPRALPGVVEAFDGNAPTDLPLVIRRSHGLGTIAWLGVDLEAEPFRSWQGADTLLLALLDSRPRAVGTMATIDATQRPPDLAGQLRVALERFAGGMPQSRLRTVSFELVAGLGLLYVACLFPLDWWLVSRGMGRPWLFWLTLPLLVATFTTLAWTLRPVAAGGGPGLLREAAQIVDIDAGSDLIRGGGWAVVYASANDRLAVRATGGAAAVSWLADAGRGFGGIDAAMPQPSLATADYVYGRTLAALEGVPIAAASTRLFEAGWSEQGGARRLVEMAKEGRLTGSLPQAAAAAISAGPWGDVRQAAADVLPLPRARGGAALPPVAELVKRGGSAEKGKGVFAGAGTCAKCHVVAGEGKMVGPDLSGVGAKLSREALWESVLAPSAAISHNYEAFTALTHDGRAISGLLVSRTPAEVVIRGADGTDTAVAAADLEDLVRQPVSLMPADLASTLTAEELVDLVAYLETLRGAK